MLKRADLDVWSLKAFHFSVKLWKSASGDGSCICAVRTGGSVFKYGWGEFRWHLWDIIHFWKYESQGIWEGSGSCNVNVGVLWSHDTIFWNGSVQVMRSSAVVHLFGREKPWLHHGLMWISSTLIVEVKLTLNELPVGVNQEAKKMYILLEEKLKYDCVYYGNSDAGQRGSCK